MNCSQGFIHSFEDDFRFFLLPGAGPVAALIRVPLFRLSATMLSAALLRSKRRLPRPTLAFVTPSSRTNPFCQVARLWSTHSTPRSTEPKKRAVQSPSRLDGSRNAPARSSCDQARRAGQPQRVMALLAAPYHSVSPLDRPSAAGAASRDPGWRRPPERYPTF